MAGQLRLVQVDLRRRRMCVVVAEEPKEGRGKVGGVVNRCDRTGLGQFLLRHDHASSPQVSDRVEAGYSGCPHR